MSVTDALVAWLISCGATDLRIPIFMSRDVLSLSLSVSLCVSVCLSLSSLFYAKLWDLFISHNSSVCACVRASVGTLKMYVMI